MSKSGEQDRDQAFREAVSQTVKSIAGKDEVEVSFGAQPTGVFGENVYLPLPPSSGSEQEFAEYRGMADALALKIAHHDTRLHNRLQPEGTQAREIFDAAEQARIEGLGATEMAGVGQNLTAKLEKFCKDEGFERVLDRQNAPLAEIIGLMIRETLTGEPVPGAAENMVAAWRPFIEDRARETLSKLCACMDNQTDFAELARQLISDLEFGDEKGESSASEEEDDNTPDAPEDGQDPDENQGGGLDSAEAPSSDQADMADQDMQSGDGVDQPVTMEAEMQSDDDADDGGNEGEIPWRPEFVSEQNAEDLYKAYTTQFDEIARAEDLGDPEELQRLRHHLDKQLAAVQSIVARLANRLQRRLLAKQNRSWQFDLEEGQLDPARLARVVVDPTNPLSFKMEQDTDFRDTVVTLLIDNSGSMRGRPIMVAAMCADILARTLERCAVKVEVLGFTTRAWKGGLTKERWASEGKPAKPGRLNDLRHIIYKEADMPWRRSRVNMGLMLKEGLLKENIDGEALLWAHKRLMARPEQRRILMVISDGAPVDDETASKNALNYLERHLRQVIAEIETRSPAELIAIGIGHDVTRYYRRAVTITDAEQLGGVMTEKLAELFDEENEGRLGKRKRGQRHGAQTGQPGGLPGSGGGPGSGPGGGTRRPLPLTGEVARQVFGRAATTGRSVRGI